MIKVRRAKEDEIDEILELDRELFSPGYFPPAQGGDVQWWLAEEDGHTVGYAAAKPCKGDPLCIYLSRVGVIRAARGRGLQRRLIRVRERWGRANGAILSVSDTLYDNVASTRSLIACGYLPFLPREPWAGRGSTYWQRSLAKVAKYAKTSKEAMPADLQGKPIFSFGPYDTTVMDPHGIFSAKP